MISNDLKNAATSGINTLDGDGNPIRVFIQVVGYIGNFLEIAHVTDLLGHNADAAHLCVFRKQKLNPHRSAHGYTTELCSSDSSSFRSGPRTKSIRQASGTEEEKLRLVKYLGMAPPSSTKVTESPMFLLHEKLSQAQSSGKIPLASCGHQLFDASFDPYRSVLVAPDHLLAGNAINIMTTCFLLLHSKRDILRVDAKICDGLRRNSLVTQAKIYDTKNNKLYSTSISGTFCTLVVASRVFEDECAALQNSSTGAISNTSELFPEAVKALGLFDVLVTKTYWYPKLHVDGYQAVKLFNSGEGFDHMQEQQRICCD